jgi:hypothetical protein
VSEGQTGIRASDAIDSFASDILRHPDQAELLKARLRKTLGVPSARKGGTRPQVKSDAGSDLDEFWDNVPI